MCSETETSPPRLSFSHDFVYAETEPVESRRDSYFSRSNSDFEFSFIRKNDEESSSADELFCNGVIVPVKSRYEIKISENPCMEKPRFSPSLRSLPRFAAKPQKTAIVDSSEFEQKQRSNFFWGFKRSSSLSEKSTLWSNSLLPRSNSTGTNPNQKRTNSKQIHRNFPENQTAAGKSYDPPLFYSSSSKSFSQTKIQRGFYGNIWINPVLNVPPLYIPKATTNLFGFGSCLRNGREKQSKK